MKPDQNQNFIKRLESQGSITTPAIAGAFKAVDRADFVPTDYLGSTYVDEPIPIAMGMTTSQPSTIAFMLERLQPQPGQKVLEIGTGSGYLTALLAELVGPAGNVYSIEYFPELTEFAKSNLQKYNFSNVELVTSNGKGGLPDKAPFDIIVSSAEARKIPAAWKKQLTVGGKLLTPFNSGIILLTKLSTRKFEEKRFPMFSFVELK